ncbi:hypothetical protein EDD22DRAFT_981909 [Suillus occidentalis]|nr:hypothetical protein EDD22DRAFT_981909 [Suillus occidentalis]
MEITEWLVKSLSQTQIDEFLKLPIKVDKLPHRAALSCKNEKVQGNKTDEKGQMLHEDVEVWMRDPVECIKDLIGNSLFHDHMVYAPVRAYKDPAGLYQVINDIWTVDWWCDKQKLLPKGATIALITLVSDKTYLSQFRGNKSAWPMYLTICNIAKKKRQKYQHEQQPLFGRNGVEMVCANSLIRQVYPILAAYVVNFLEQCLVACCKENWCPKCLVAADEQGDLLTLLMQDPEVTKEVLEKRKNGQHPIQLDKNGLYEMDSCFKAMPDYPGLQHFKKGILTVRQWMGTEHKEMQCVFVGLLAGAVPRAHLVVFHTNKDILQELEICKHFNIPKLHQISHFVKSITLFGSTDSLNTELPEQLHIDFAKDTYRASNKHNYKEQMALWLQWQEAVFLRSSYLDLLSEQSQSATASSHTDPNHRNNLDSDLDTEIEDPQQSVDHLITTHGATMFLPALKSFMHKHMPHNNIISVIIITPPDPCTSDSPNQWSPARFNMALISDGFNVILTEMDTVGVRVVQVCIIFALPPYIEWFMLLWEPDPSSGLCQVSCSTCQLHRNAAMIHLDEIVCLCHLIPKMGLSVDPGWTSTNVYETAHDFI